MAYKKNFQYVIANGQDQDLIISLDCDNTHNPNQLKEMMHDIKQNSKHKPNEIIFYDLNENNLKAYEKEDFKTVSRW